MKIPEALAPGEGGGHLALDRLGLAEYVTFHGVGFSFYGLFELRFTTWRLGTPTLVVAQFPFQENRHLFSSHDEPDCLAGSAMHIALIIPVFVEALLAGCSRGPLKLLSRP